MNPIKSGANIDVSSHPEVIKDLMAIAELEYDPDAGVQTTQEPTTQEDK